MEAPPPLTVRQSAYPIILFPTQVVWWPPPASAADPAGIAVFHVQVPQLLFSVDVGLKVAVHLSPADVVAAVAEFTLMSALVQPLVHDPDPFLPGGILDEYRSHSMSSFQQTVFLLRISYQFTMK